MVSRTRAGWSWVVIAGALAATGLPVRAQEGAEEAGEAEAKPVEDGLMEGARAAEEILERADGEDKERKISLGAGFNIASAYIFRGIPQENQGVMVQPWVELGFDLYEGNGALPSISAVAGQWNSIHSNIPSNPWYESDFYAGFALGFPKGIELGVTYVYLYGPNIGDIFAEEIDVALSFDESEVVPDLPLAFNPYALVALEVDGGSDGRGGEGNYLELGLEPEYVLELDQLEDYPITLSAPLRLGLGLDEYYEDAFGNDDTFGFFEVGIVAGVPLTFLSGKGYGDWSLTGGVYFTVLGDSAANIGGPADFNVTDGDELIVWTSWGLELTY